MRLEWLEDILAVAETGSFLHAAERRHLTQSAFSRRIRTIEDYIGVALFDRSRKPVQLRAPTEEQRENITRLAMELRQLVSDLRQGEQASARRIVVVSQHALAAGLTPALIGNVQLQRDDIFLHLRSANLDQCFAQLLARQADIAIVYRQDGIDHPVHPDFVEVAEVGTDRLVPVIAATQRKAVLAQMARGQLPLIAYPSDVFMGQVVARQLLPRLCDGLVPLARAETALTLAAQEMAARGLGLAWVPQSLAATELATGRLCDLTGVEGLPACTLHVTAVRVAGAVEGAQAAVWTWILESAARRLGD